ncbi:hypothetical protein [Apilactobacillus kunkeei]|uniref:Uncharacterized protein n=1 Tax=Apilactobacillus kunkeei TaxID=148814 RepID=A0A1L8CGW6_9LACO|nr:hypothetical protein [Apilactobacillus kunkeei]GAT90418.1 hypothetical protein FF306_00516 [Apilactobacillus kunkeei]
MKESNGIKVSNYWKKALYSSVVLGAIFVGGQYIGSVNVHASYLIFKDSTTGENVYYAHGVMGETINLDNMITILNDRGEDTSNVPSSYTITQGDNYINVSPKKDNKTNVNSEDNVSITILDQNDDYVETRGYKLNGGLSNFDKIISDLESSGYKITEHSISDFKDDWENSDEDDGAKYSYTLNVVLPEHIQNVHYVDQNGNNVATVQHPVTSYGHTYIWDLTAKYSVPGDQLIDNKLTDSTIKVQYVPGNDNLPTLDQYINGTFGRNDVATVSKAPTTNAAFNPLNHVYHSMVSVEDMNGKLIERDILSSDSDSIVDTSYFVEKYVSGVKYVNNNGIIPDYIDLTKGPYTFKINRPSEYPVTKQDDQSSSAQSSAQSSATPSSAASQSAQQTQAVAKPAPVVQSHPAAAPDSTAKAAPAPQPAKAKPSKSQLKAVAKSYKQSKHAVKTDTAKLKALKKKMKKHATKKQKVAYKSLQIKLAADKKAVKSYKAQEGKLTKYFKEVSIINRDNKQIKSLTAQLKKLKKKHSKANKKKAAKVQKALKKANNSLKAATKFVNDYK